MLNIDSDPMITPITKEGRAKKLRSTSGDAARDSTISSSTSATAASANGPATESGAVRACGTSCSAKTSDTIRVASRTNPRKSGRRPCVAWARIAAEPAARPAMAAAMSTTLSQKITRQPVKCVSAPPSSGPMLKPSIRNPVQAPIAAALRSGPALVSTAARVPGTAKAAASPCRARPASSAVCEPAVAMMQDAMPNSTRPAIDARRTPNRSAASPPSTMQAAETTRYALTAHSTPPGPSASSVRMSGRAAMMAVLLAPTASIARHDAHRIGADPVRWFKIAASSVRSRGRKPHPDPD